LEEVAGAGRVAPPLPVSAAALVQTVLSYNEADGSGEQGAFILFPVFGGVMPRQKSSLSMALRVEIFRALFGKYFPSIERLDSRNGR